MSNENTAIVMYHIGLSDNRFFENMDLDELLSIADNIAKDWSSQKDIRSNGEEGYIGEYARRSINELTKEHYKDTVWRLTQEDISPSIVKAIAHDFVVDEKDVLEDVELKKIHDQMMKHFILTFGIYNWEEYVDDFASSTLSIILRNKEKKEKEWVALERERLAREEVKHHHIDSFRMTYRVEANVSGYQSIFADVSSLGGDTKIDHGIFERDDSYERRWIVMGKNSDDILFEVSPRADDQAVYKHLALALHDTSIRQLTPLKLDSMNHPDICVCYF
ncbi:hypothetical protein ACQR3P_29155 [Rhodococcus sp. IEGM1300]